MAPWPAARDHVTSDGVAESTGIGHRASGVDGERAERSVGCGREQRFRRAVDRVARDRGPVRHQHVVRPGELEGRVVVRRHVEGGEG